MISESFRTIEKKHSITLENRENVKFYKSAEKV